MKVRIPGSCPVNLLCLDLGRGFLEHLRILTDIEVKRKVCILQNMLGATMVHVHLHSQFSLLVAVHDIINMFISSVSPQLVKHCR